MGWHGELAANRKIVLDDRRPMAHGGPSSIELRRIMHGHCPSSSLRSFAHTPSLKRGGLVRAGSLEKLSSIFGFVVQAKHVFHEPDMFAALEGPDTIKIVTYGGHEEIPVTDIQPDHVLAPNQTIAFRERRYPKPVPKFAPWDGMRCWGRFRTLQGKSARAKSLIAPVQEAMMHN